jgi:DNA-binding transcriptional regulator YiaG
MTPATVRRIRRGLGLTQTELAERVGVQRNTVTRWEMGALAVPPTARILLAMLAQQPKRRTKP